MTFARAKNRSARCCLRRAGGRFGRGGETALREIAKLRVKMETDNTTLVPLEIYFRRGFAKVELGVCKGKKLHDKREALKKKSDRRDMDRFSKRGRDR